MYTTGTEYQSARELFGAARAAALELGRVGAALARMRPDEPARADYERLTAGRVRRCRTVVGLAGRACYGGDGTGGLAALMPGAGADVLYMRYVLGLKWPAVASRVGLCERTCRDRARAALDLADAWGVDALIGGPAPTPDEP